jgi:uncharacterized membrane protein YidH (DUF202 family)
MREGQVNTRFSLAFARMSFGLLAVVAIVSQLAIQIELGFSIVNFFSYFTNLANIIAASVLILSAWRALAGHETMRLGDQVRAASVVYMAVVGIVFGVLLRDVDLGALLPWVNFVLHVLMPCVVVIDWFLLPPRRALAIRDLLLWLIVPVLYLVYVLIRGSLIHWYPYPFLNPGVSGGYLSVAVYIIGIALVFLLVGWVLLALGKPRGSRDAPR